MTDSRDPANLRDQVSAAGSALQREAREAARRELPRPPADRRLLAAAAVFALVVTMWFNLDALRGGEPDAVEALDATIQTIEMTRQVVQAHWDSTGTPPASLADIGLGDLPFAYSATAADFRIAALAATGDSVGYQSPSRMPATGARP